MPAKNIPPPIVDAIIPDLANASNADKIEVLAFLVELEAAIVAVTAPPVGNA